MAEQGKRAATYADIEAAPEHLVAEIIDGALVTRRHGRPANAMARAALMFAVNPFRRSRSNADADWQIMHLPEIHLSGSIVVPELAGWRFTRMPILPDEHPHLAPDWVCELTSSDGSVNAALETKLALYFSVGVQHVWIVDLTTRRLCAFGRGPSGWQRIAQTGESGEILAPPFDAISFLLADLWPFDPPLGLNEDPTPNYAGDR